MKELLTTEQLIDHMKAKGITFNIISEQDAKTFLTNNNYYMKLASYRKNYKKSTVGATAGQYTNLDFAYLKELSTIDMHLRYLILKMCLDIEHSLKVSLLNHVENNPNEDGYELIRCFLGYTNNEGKLQNERILKKIRDHRFSDYSKDLIDKYYPYFPVWVFVELISFGDLTYLIAFYDKKYSDPIVNNKFMNIVRDIRNASAHSNCLINKLFEPFPSGQQPDSTITNHIAAIPGISKSARTKYLGYKVVYNFVTLIYIYNTVIPSGSAKSKRILEIKELFNTRMTRNQNYFATNNQLTSLYNFVKKVVDSL